MKDIEKLRVLLPHWIEHNNGHSAECAKWVEIAKNSGAEKVASHIEAANIAMNEVNSLLEKALAEAGGAMIKEGHHHHHH